MCGARAGSPFKFSAHTSYEADYPAHAIAPHSPPPPREQRPRGARFDATSSYTVRPASSQQRDPSANPHGPGLANSA